MMDIPVIFRRQRKYIFTLLSIYVLGWGFTDNQAIYAGLMLGTSVSLYNLWLLVRKMQNFGDAVVQGKKVRSLGAMSRMAAAGLAIFIALQYPGEFHLVSTVLGLMTSYLVIMIDFFIQSVHIRR